MWGGWSKLAGMAYITGEAREQVTMFPVTLDVLVPADHLCRVIEAFVKRLFCKALGDRSHPQPRVINTDLAPIHSSAIPDSKKEGTLRNRCRHRPVQ